MPKVGRGESRDFDRRKSRKSKRNANNGEIKSLDVAIRNLESNNESAGHIELSEVTSALQRLDPVWEVLYPEEQRRVIELLIESITVNKKEVAIQFRANGIEQIVGELKPMSERENGKSKKKK